MKIKNRATGGRETPFDTYMPGGEGGTHLNGPNRVAITKRTSFWSWNHTQVDRDNIFHSFMEENRHSDILKGLTGDLKSFSGGN